MYLSKNNFYKGQVTKRKVLPINYTNAMKYKDLGHGKKRVILSIPKLMKTQTREFIAHLMVDIYPIKQIEF